MSMTLRPPKSKELDAYSVANNTFDHHIKHLEDSLKEAKKAKEVAEANHLEQVPGLELNEGDIVYYPGGLYELDRISTGADKKVFIKIMEIIPEYNDYSSKAVGLVQYARKVHTYVFRIDLDSYYLVYKGVVES